MAVYNHLLSQGRINGMTLRNRIVVTAMGVSFSEEDGFVNERLTAYHERQAEGGAGLIILGVTAVGHPLGVVASGQTGISDDKYIPGLRQLTERVHRHGAKIAAQLHFGGLVAGYSAKWGLPLWAPAMPKPFEGDFGSQFMPEELAAFSGSVTPEIKVMTKEDIAHVVNLYAQGARRAKEAGMDAVEIHGGHGYLISSFVSPSSNTRTDEYGGSLENRMRLYVEVIQAVRNEVGPDFPIICKLDTREVGKKVGIDFDLAKQAAQIAERAGADAITATAYHDTGMGKLHSESNIPHIPNTNLPGAAAIKSVVNIPVLASGRVEFDDADKAIGDANCDFVAFGRKMLADPYFPKKLSEDRERDVRPCIYCYTCVSAIYLRQSSRCAVNSETGLEYQIKDHSKTAKKRFVIVGGGPSGMESARLLDKEGHEVILLEKDQRLGGTLRIASLAYEPNNRMLDWLIREIEKSQVDVRLNTLATPELVQSLKPDSVIVGVGAVRSMPDIPGKEHNLVFSGDELRAMLSGNMTEALKQKTSWFDRMSSKIGAATGLTGSPEMLRAATKAYMPLGDRIAIIGGELVGLELAEFLAERGRKVTVVDDAPIFGSGLTVVRRMRLVTELKEHGIAMYPGSSDIEIQSHGIAFKDAKGQHHEIGADNVIVAKGAHGDSTLANALRAAGLNVTEVGDGTGVGYIEGAIRGAYNAVDALLA